MTILSLMTALVGVTLFLGLLRLRQGDDYAHFLGMFIVAATVVVMTLVGVPLQ